MATSYRGSSNKWQFSEEEIRAKLEELGYNNIPDEALKEFSSGMKLRGKQNKTNSKNGFLLFSIFKK